MSFTLSDYDYSLPEDLIAVKPVIPQSEARMLVCNNQRIIHSQVKNIEKFLNSNTLIVINNTRVIPARFIGRRKSGRYIELLLVEKKSSKKWLCKIKNSRSLVIGEEVIINDSFSFILNGKQEDGLCAIEFCCEEDIDVCIEKYGLPPIPPYILKKRKKEDFFTDKENYQTCFSEKTGSIAAPTAGLHFCKDFFHQLQQKFQFVEITHHIGIGTFENIKCDDFRLHKMHQEELIISDAAAQKLNHAKKENRPILAIGTTVTRALESAFYQGKIIAGRHTTDLFIYPPYRFRFIDALLTNFHLPCSSLLLLVAAYMTREKLLHTYQIAVENKYRFYSYGDCMLLL